MRIDLFVTGFNRPDLLREQKRLFDKYLQDEFSICLVDNSTSDLFAMLMERACRETGCGYQRSPDTKKGHDNALNHAARVATQDGCEYWMTLDHDVFPRRPTTLINKIDAAGFYGIGQWHTPSQSRYLWPGFAGFSRAWLNGRIPNFSGIRGDNKRDDGDCGSMLAAMFQDDDWPKLPRTEHGYLVIRPEDGYGLQSYGVEFFDDFLHLTNASHWMKVPNPEERDELLKQMVACL